MEKNLTKRCRKLYRKFKLEGRTIILCIVDDKNTRLVRVGHSVCNPQDKFDEELGKKIAYNRATHPDKEKSMSYFHLPKEMKTFGLFRYFLEETEEMIRLDPKPLLPVLNKKEKPKTTEE